MSRAPDGQPTSNIMTVLNNERQSFLYWEQSNAIETKALERSKRMMVIQREVVRRLEEQLATRLAEEAAAPVVVTGL